MSQDSTNMTQEWHKAQARVAGNSGNHRILVERRTGLLVDVEHDELICHLASIVCGEGMQEVAKRPGPVCFECSGQASIQHNDPVVVGVVWNHEVSAVHISCVRSESVFAQQTDLCFSMRLWDNHFREIWGEVCSGNPPWM